MSLNSIVREERQYYGQLVIVMGLLGSIAFAGLILILGSPTRFQINVLIGPLFGISSLQLLIPRDLYFGSLIFLLMLVSVGSLLGSIAAANMASFGYGSDRYLRAYTVLCIGGALVCFLVVLPALIAPIDFGVIDYVIPIELGLFFFLLYRLFRLDSLRRPAQ